MRTASIAITPKTLRTTRTAARAITSTFAPRITASITPSITATITRRVLITYAVDPDVAAAVLPSPFRPDLTMGPALGGVCLLRLRHVRPTGLPARTGMSMETVAHRMAVEWDTPDGVAIGVYVFRRDADSALAARLGRIHRAAFGVVEGAGRYSIAAQSLDGAMSVAFAGERADAMPAGSVFTGPDSASAFFHCASIGYAPGRDGVGGIGGHTALRLVTPPWRGIPVRADYVQSSFFEDRFRFPKGTAVFDSALAVHDVPARWEPVHEPVGGRRAPTARVTSACTTPEAARRPSAPARTRSSPP